MLSRRVRADGAEQAVLLVVGSCGEEQCVGGAVVGGAVAELERPEAVDGQRGVRPRAQLAGGHKYVRMHFAVGGDAAVAEFADEQVARETTEGRRCPGEPPWGVQTPELGNPRDQVARGVKGVDDAEALAVR